MVWFVSVISQGKPVVQFKSVEVEFTYPGDSWVEAPPSALTPRNADPAAFS
jgi:hypothetical protein